MMVVAAAESETEALDVWLDVLRNFWSCKGLTSVPRYRNSELGVEKLGGRVGGGEGLSEVGRLAGNNRRLSGGGGL